MVWKYLWSSSTQEITTSKDGEAIVSTQTASMELREENITVVTEDVTLATSSAPVPADAQPPVRKRRISIRQAISFPKSVSSQNKLESPQTIPQPPKDAPPPPAPVEPAETKPVGRVRRLSIQAFSPRSKSTPVQPKQTTSSPPTSSPIPAVSVPKETPAQPAKQNLSRADRQAQKSAQRLQILITGDTGVASPLVSPVTAKNRVDKIKSQLSNPTSGNRVIAELRKLPVVGHGPKSDAPIHAVCLEHTDAEEDALHFSKLCASNADVGIQDATSASSPVDKMAAVLQDMRIIDLVTAPDLGIGQPGDGKGLLAGAVPTAETVLNGVKQITPQLLALGYATGQMITPDHTSVYPPTDRISVLTYWWGMELLLPPPTLHYLETVQSITGSIVNFLSAMALVNNGVREILPLVRYIAQFVDLEYKSIKAQDKGKGVVCAATWLMPAALVPRPWDFPDPPSEVESAPAAANSKALTAGDDAPEEKVVISPPKIDNAPPSQVQG